MAYRALYSAAAGRRQEVVFEVNDLAPSGMDMKVSTIMFGAPGFLSAARMAELTDLESGEVYEDAWRHFLQVWLEGQRGADGRVPLVSVIDAVPIQGCGSVASGELARAFGTWEGFWAMVCRAASGDGAAEEGLLQVTAVGPALVESLKEFARSDAGDAWVELIVARLEVAPAANGGHPSPLLGKRVVFTGTLPELSRSAARRLAEQAGALVAGAISDKVDYLVAGHGAGAKLSRAADLGIPVLDEAAFLKLVGAA